MQIFIVTEEQEEGGWGGSDFDLEAYYTEQEAIDRAKILNKEKPDYCGYYFAVRPAELKGKEC